MEALMPSPSISATIHRLTASEPLRLLVMGGATKDEAIILGRAIAQHVDAPGVQMTINQRTYDMASAMQPPDVVGLMHIADGMPMPDASPLYVLKPLRLEAPCGMNRPHAIREALLLSRALSESHRAWGSPIVLAMAGDEREIRARRDHAIIQDVARVLAESGRYRKVG
jgi:hypothetical protein